MSLMKIKLRDAICLIFDLVKCVLFFQDVEKMDGKIVPKDPTYACDWMA